MQALERRAGLEPELVDQCLAALLVMAQGIGLAAGVIERQHQLTAELLTQRVLGHERFELAHDLRVATDGHVRLYPLLDHRQSKLF